MLTGTASELEYSLDGKYLIGLRAYRLYSPKRLENVARLETVVLVNADSYRDRSGAVLRLFLLAVNDKYLSSSGRCNSRKSCSEAFTYVYILLEPLLQPKYDTLCGSQFMGYFNLHAATFQPTDNSAT